MQITVNEIEDCRLNINYTSDVETVMNKRAEVLNAFKKAPLKGYRKGHSSVNAIKFQYKDQMEDAVKRAMAEDAFHETLFEKQFKPLGTPKFNALNLEGNSFSCEFELCVKPNFELAPFKELELPKPHSTESVDVVLESMLQELRIQAGDTAPFTETDFVQAGDNVIIDYEGFIDGVRADNLCVTGEMVTVGKSNLPIFDDNLLGMAIGETREFDLTVPKEGLPSIANKPIHIKVTLNAGSKITPCPLDDTLAIKAGKKDFAELRDFVSGHAFARVSQLHQAKMSETVANRLLADNTVKVPQWLSLSEAQYLAHQGKLDWATLTDQDREKYLELAEKNVKLSLILDRIRDEEPEAQLTDQETFEIIKQNLANTKMQTSLEDAMKEMQKTGLLQVLVARIRDEHTLATVIKSAKIIE